ncbi:P-loop containing nucleoside triphosphate hydrolase protein [Thelonectria olida]|uniref:P-loop containing nucleoside triphosphate hydrolase protein n=1 Tax=Thelonectria olida TaxID=1576542 RepID=A0A9P8VY74_9HYPO|nr:P-loop containing nucleoside triphosphate hydrolase protein [Thelonectria olida]
MALFAVVYPRIWELRDPSPVASLATGDLDYFACILHAPSSLGLFLFTSYQITTQHIQLRRFWAPARLVSLLLQLLLISNFIATVVLRLPKENLPDEQLLYLAVRASTILATTVNITSLCLGLSSTGRGLYHLALCLLWPRISSAIDLNAAKQCIGDDAFLGIFVAAALLDAFYPSPIQPGQHHLKRTGLAIFQKMTFDWLNPLFRIKEALRVDHLTQEKLPRDFPSYEQRFYNACLSATGGSSISFFAFLLREHRGQIARASLLRLVDDASKFCIPWLLRSFLADVSARTLAQLFVVRIVGTLCGNYSGLALRETSAQYRAMLSSVLHAKALRLGYYGPSAADPDLATLSEVDSFRLSQAVLMILDIWSFPLQVVLSLGGVLYLLSWQGILAALLATTFTFPLLGLIKRAGFWIQSNMAAKDRRTALTAEILNGIKTIKLHGWESAFNEKLELARQKDLETTARQAVFNAIMVSITQTIPSALIVASFGLVIWSGGAINSQLVFTCILLFTLLSSSVISLSGIAPQLQMMSTSMARVVKYLVIDETEHSGPLLTEVDRGSQDQILSVRTAKLRWPGHQPIVGGGSFSIYPGTIAMVQGQTGSGKSTLLSSLLPHIKNGHSIAYFQQDPVLITGTIRDNILLGKPFNYDRYQAAIHSCALASDLSLFIDGDMTVLGGSASVSGGQRARISLARVVYTDADVNILDDPFSALDIKAHRTVVKRLLGANGILRKSTNIVVSSSELLAAEADSIISLQGGTIVQEAGELIAMAENSSVDASSGLTATTSDQVGNFAATPKTPIRGITELPPSPIEFQESGGAVTEGLLAHPIEPQDAEEAVIKHARSSSTPKPKENPLRKFLDYCGIWGWCGAASLLMLGRLSSVASLVVLKNVAAAEDSASAAADLGIYCIFSILQVIFFFLFVVLLYRWAILPGQRVFHAHLVSAVLSQSLEYFEQRKPGDILNLFTDSLMRVDVGMMSSIITLVGQYTNLLISASVLTLTAPTSLVFLVPLMVLCYYVQRLYVDKLRELRHLDVQARAPILGLLQQAQRGRVMFSAFGYTTHQLEQFTGLIEDSMRAFFNLTCLEPWLAVRLDVCSVTLQVFAGISLIVSSVDTGTIGFVMTYVFQITLIFSVISRFSAQLETDLVSFSRILECIEASEDKANAETASERFHVSRYPVGQRFIPPSTWPYAGKISLSAFSASYKDDSPLCLDSINLDIAPGEKVAVIGRTGAGKSSFLLAILGLANSCSGHVHVDDIDIYAANDSMYRQNLALIPQEPVIFAGSVRENLDPLKRCTDSAMQDALDKTGFESAIRKSLVRKTDEAQLRASVLDLRLDSDLQLSAGEIQLLALARAVLQNAKILLLDEATASLDPDTERKMHKLIQHHFEDVTTIAVMHKLETTEAYDKVLVLDSGRVLEFDTPASLLNRPGTRYSAMMSEAGLLDNAGETLGLL